MKWFTTIGGIMAFVACTFFMVAISHELLRNVACKGAAQAHNLDPSNCQMWKE